MSHNLQRQLSHHSHGRQQNADLSPGRVRQRISHIYLGILYDRSNVYYITSQNYCAYYIIDRMYILHLRFSVEFILDPIYCYVTYHRFSVELIISQIQCIYDISDLLWNYMLDLMYILHLRFSVKSYIRSKLYTLHISQTQCEIMLDLMYIIISDLV